MFSHQMAIMLNVSYYYMLEFFSILLFIGFEFQLQHVYLLFVGFN